MGEYAIYLRKSRADLELEAKGEMETLARHEKQLLELAQRMKISVTSIYKEVVSGETIAARPVVQQLLSEVEDGKWEGVLVMEVERLARGDTIDQGTVARAFKMSGTKIITPIKTYDPENEFDEEYFEFGLFMSRREYKTINRRIQRGRIASAKEGKYLASVPPFGYDKVKIKNDKGYTLKPNGSAPVVKQIYNMYLNEKIGCTKIANKLNSMGIRTYTNSEWTKSSIRDILSNPVYAGYIRWSYKKETKTITNGIVKKTRTKSKDKCILVDGLHEAIIDRTTFERVQKELNNNYRTPTKSNAELQFSLSGLIYCKKCGALMHRLGPNARNPYDTLRCMTKGCTNVSAPLYMVENMLLAVIKRELSKYKIDASKYIDNDDMIKDKTQLLSSLNTELKQITNQVGKTYDFLEQGIYTTEVFIARNRELTNRKNDIENAITKLQNEIDLLEAASVRSKKSLPEMEHAIELYEKSELPSTRNEILREIIRRVEYEKNERNRKGALETYNFTLDVALKL